ncbi:MAG: tRNA pseudouridine(55) synthase TruB [Caldilineae bacterium]|nr:MAG: tRNA pseudouridine(55) synthase TruB [Caldilineae bacterium]
MMGRTKPGVLNIDKPAGMTSHDVVAAVRRHTGIRKVGHAGTLDPLATGVLLVCVGQATRVVEYLQRGQKEYVVRIRLGEETTTYDAEGEVVARHEVPALTAHELRAVLQGFVGEVMQQPPMYSAVKYRGRPLYKLAREGKKIEARKRPVRIHAFELLRWETPDLEARVVCSPGTYVRSLAHDVGVALGCGAHVQALRRTASGTWRVEDAIPLEVFLASGEDWPRYVHGLRAALSMLPPLVLEDEMAYRFALGQRVRLEAAVGRGEYRVLSADEKLVGVGRVMDEGALLAPHKVLVDPQMLLPEVQEG